MSILISTIKSIIHIKYAKTKVLTFLFILICLCDDDEGPKYSKQRGEQNLLPHPISFSLWIYIDLKFSIIFNLTLLDS